MFELPQLVAELCHCTDLSLELSHDQRGGPKRVGDARPHGGDQLGEHQPQQGCQGGDVV